MWEIEIAMKDCSMMHSLHVYSQAYCILWRRTRRCNGRQRIGVGSQGAVDGGPQRRGQTTSHVTTE